MTHAGTSIQRVPDLVSVITPAYNATKFIAETYRSLQAQTYSNWEWVVVDDVSTDDTLGILQELAAKDSRVRPLRMVRKGTGPASVRNLAMQNARGEFFALLDADDLWEPDKLAIQVDYLRKNPEVDGSCTWLDMFGYEPRVRQTHIRRHPQVVIGHREFVRRMTMTTPTVLFRRQCYEQIGPMDEDPKLYGIEDEEYFARLTSRFNFHRVCQILTHVRIHPPRGSITATLHQRDATCRLYIADVLLRKEVITASEGRRMRGRFYATEAADALFLRHAPFRGYLVKSILTGRPPLRAIVMLGLSCLPAALLRPVLLALQRLATACARHAGQLKQS